jgi:hypothetical protein
MSCGVPDPRSRRVLSVNIEGAAALRIQRQIDTYEAIEMAVIWPRQPPAPATVRQILQCGRHTDVAPRDRTSLG